MRRNGAASRCICGYPNNRIQLFMATARRHDCACEVSQARAWLNGQVLEGQAEGSERQVGTAQSLQRSDGRTTEVLDPASKAERGASGRRGPVTTAQNMVARSAFTTQPSADCYRTPSHVQLSSPRKDSSHGPWMRSNIPLRKENAPELTDQQHPGPRHQVYAFGPDRNSSVGGLLTLTHA